ncbi:MAG: hypothetical protein AB1611_18710 [bacterium]
MFLQRLGSALVIAAFLLLFLLPSFCRADWNVYTIQPLNHFISWYSVRSLALDDQGCAHLAYGSDSLYYAHSLTGEGYPAWLVENLSTAAGVDGDEVSDGKASGFAALALDAADNPHLCYYAHGCLIYTRRKGIAWITKTIDDSHHVGTSISIVLGPEGSAHISFYDCQQKCLKYVFIRESKAGSGPEPGSAGEPDPEIIPEIIDDSADVGMVNSLSLDSAGNVHLAYYDWSHRDLKYACKRGSRWEIQVVDSFGDVGDWPALAVDQDGHPHLSYCDWTNRNLKYARHTGEGWNLETVDASDDDTGRCTAIALDREGRPQISYFNLSRHRLMYAAHDGRTWQTRVVSEDEDIEGSTALAIDSSGQSHIIYYNYTTGSLKYALFRKDSRLSQSSESSDWPIAGGKNAPAAVDVGCFLSVIKTLW